MKKIFIPLLAGLVLSCAQAPVKAQDSKEEKQKIKEQEREQRQKEKQAERQERYQKEYPEQVKEHITKEYSIKQASAGMLAVYNLDGSVKVEGYAGDKVIIEIDKTVSAPTVDILEQGKKEIKLGFEQIGDSVVAYIQAPWDTRPHDWRDSYDWPERRRIEYRCKLEYTIKVPFNMNLRVSTINDGDVLVKNVSGVLHVNNVNGAIAILNAKGTTHAHTINGDLSVNYLSNPPESSSFYTLNGKLTAIFQPNLSADLQFRSMNGAFFTDFPDVEMLAPTITKNQDKRGDGTVYKMSKDTKMRIGAGGKQFKFETLNGNIYIKKQS